jgi:hypothetical protein
VGAFEGGVESVEKVAGMEEEKESSSEYPREETSEQ